MEERDPGSHPPGAWEGGHLIGGGLIGGDLTARLERWAVDVRVEDAARQRSRERWLRQQAEEGGSLAGVLADLAERGTEVALRTNAGRQYRGRVRAVGADFVAVADGGGDVILAQAAISSLRTRPGDRPATGDRIVRSRLRLAEVLAGLAAERERILVVPASGAETLAGVLRAVGRDVVVLRLDGENGAAAYLPLAAVSEVVLGGGH